jgi:SAM-dependent methyltransferase
MASSKEVTQDFLDSVQYQPESILQYERVYGEDFVSPGGKALAQEMIGRLELAPGSRVLDVGCGLGGSAFVMAREFDLKVDGIDLSKNMLEIANRKLTAYGLAGLATYFYISTINPACFRFYMPRYAPAGGCCSPIIVAVPNLGRMSSPIMYATASTTYTPRKPMQG